MSSASDATRDIISDRDAITEIHRLKARFIAQSAGLTAEQRSIAAIIFDDCIKEDVPEAQKEGEPISVVLQDLMASIEEWKESQGIVAMKREERSMTPAKTAKKPFFDIVAEEARIQRPGAEEQILNKVVRIKQEGEAELLRAQEHLNKLKDQLRFEEIVGLTGPARVLLEANIERAKTSYKRVKSTTTQKIQEAEEEDARLSIIAADAAVHLKRNTSFEVEWKKKHRVHRYALVTKLRIRVPDAYWGSQRYMRVLESFYRQRNKFKIEKMTDEKVEELRLQSELSRSYETAIEGWAGVCLAQDNTVYTTYNPARKDFDSDSEIEPDEAGKVKENEGEKKKEENKKRILPSPHLSPPTSTTFPTAFHFPPFPTLSTSNLAHFINGATIAIENIAEDYANDSEATLLELVDGLEEEKPTVPDDDYDYRSSIMRGGEWVYGAIKTVCAEQEGGTLNLTSMCKELLEWVDMEGGMSEGLGAGGALVAMENRERRLGSC